MVKVSFMNNVLPGGNNTMTKPELQDLIHRHTSCTGGACCQLMQAMEKAGVLKLSATPTPKPDTKATPTPKAQDTRYRF